MGENHERLMSAFFRAADRNEYIAALEAEVERLRETLDVVYSRCTMWADSGANLEGHRLRLVRLAQLARAALEPQP